ncbi:MAG: hypothetical protein ABJG68_11245 [Crocinitomicaceae bacterium]
MSKLLKHICTLLVFGSTLAFGQGEWTNVSTAERPISPAYRITEKPVIIDTIVPIPNIEYPEILRSKETEINLQDINAAKIKIVDKLDKLYPGYVKLGLGNYLSPLGEFYYNSTRNRRTNMGVHLKHNSSWGKLPGWSPQSFDNTSAKLFGEFFTGDFKIESEIDYQNNGYHFYGIQDTTDFFTNDSLLNRVQGFNGMFKLSNYSNKDSAKLLWSAKLGNRYFHEFQREWDPSDKHARNNNFQAGATFKYKLNKNVYNLDFDWLYNRYWYAENDGNLTSAERFNERNANIHLRPTISTYGDKWKVVYGLDATFDFPKVDANEAIFKVVPVIEAKYSLFNDIFIPYVGIDGGVTQNSFYTLNRLNPYMYSGTELRNEKLFNLYGGIKGTLSKTTSFNVAAHLKNYKNKALFVNMNTPQANGLINTELNRFDVIYDNINSWGIEGSMSYQKNEKLKIDAIAQYYRYSPENELFAWHLPELKFTLRGSYNLFDKIYAKADFTLEQGRKSPVYLFNQADDNIPVNMRAIADGNLSVEYRYNSRVSAFIQFNNIAGQRYDRWYNYRTQGFQVLGGVTFAF